LRKLAAIVENGARFPAPYEFNLGVGLRDAAPTLRAIALLPQSIELLESRVAGEAALDQKAADHHPGTTDTSSAVHVHATARQQSIV
jgi:hypothetical protein